ncbi:hypothetical protein [Phyllobacterium chamaecytisi]|uniref:hypothetical protein n=1 Tax=Phyllobacterium chamaecytisi TaxID=2876082 RepID=UPI001CCFE01C|nr:hypothetical protein [Phyllobacterium sp. KW56]MBZ9603329.1 hypothetical protein [Phyllobacterium sp. KW56]
MSETYVHISDAALVSDMTNDPIDLKRAMIERIGADAWLKVWTPSDFIDLASRAAVDRRYSG